MDLTNDLAQQVAIVTGGAQGIGLAIVRILDEHGARVVVADINQGRAQEVAASLKEGLARLTESSYVVRSANLLISIFLDKKASYNRAKDLQAIGACIQNMLLEAQSLGLGTCWLGEILNKEKKVCRLLKAPSHYELMAVISLGWPKKRRVRGNRKRLNSLIYNRYK